MKSEMRASYIAPSVEVLGTMSDLTLANGGGQGWDSGTFMNPHISHHDSYGS